MYTLFSVSPCIQINISPQNVSLWMYLFALQSKMTIYTTMKFKQKINTRLFTVADCHERGCGQNLRGNTRMTGRSSIAAPPPGNHWTVKYFANSACQESNCLDIPEHTHTHQSPNEKNSHHLLKWRAKKREREIWKSNIWGKKLVLQASKYYCKNAIRLKVAIWCRWKK